MKNISRRVFIKGMAVAAVAAAASTVLAGCNLPVGPEEETPVAGFQPETKTLSFKDDKSIVIGTTAFATAKSAYAAKYDDRAVLSVHIVNKAEKNVWMWDGFAGYEGYVDVDVFLDNVGVQAGWVNQGTKTDLYHKEVVANSNTLDTYVDGDLYFSIPDDGKDWKKMTVVFNATVNGETQKTTFTINR